MSSAARRDRRYRVRIPARILRGKEPTIVLTENVSYRGVFLRTDTPPALRQLLRLELVLAPLGHEIGVHAMAVYVVPPGLADRTAGVGAQFYALDAVSQRLWDEFIDHVKEEHPESMRSSLMGLPAADPEVDPVQRRFERYKAELEVRLETVEHLERMMTLDVSLGGMFVATPQEIPTGSEVCLNVVHPRTEATFPMDCVVKRVVREPRLSGIGVEFLLSELARHEFAAFVKSGLPIATEEEAIFIDEADPKLA